MEITVAMDHEVNIQAVMLQPGRLAHVTPFSLQDDFEVPDVSQYVASAGKVVLERVTFDFASRY